MRHVKNNSAYLLILTIITGIAYHNGLFGEFLIDDNSLLIDKNLGNLTYILTHNFLLVASFVRFLIFRLGGLQPFYFHLFNIMIHLFNVWLVYILVLTLSQGKNKQRIAFMTASLFAVHPILTESITWISGMTYPLSTFFILGSFLFYIKAHTKQSRVLYIGSLFLFGLSLLSSEKTIVFPLILIAYSLTHVPHKNWKWIFPYILLSLFFILVVYLPKITPRIQYTQLITSGSQSQNTLDLFAPGAALITYLILLVLPFRLTLYHADTVNKITNAVGLMVIFLFFSSLIYFWKKEKKIFFWLSFFLISLSFALTPLPITSFVAERYMYLGSIALFYLFSSALIFLGTKYRIPVLSWFIFGVCVILLTARTINRNNDWKTKESFWSSTAISSPLSYQAHTNYGLVLMEQGKSKRAVEELDKAIHLKPDYAEAHEYLGDGYQSMGKWAESLHEYQIAIKIKPTLWRVYQNMGGVYFGLRRYDDSLIYVKKALSLVPTSADLQTNIGVIYMRKGDKEKAKTAFLKALELDPKFNKAKQGLSLLQ